MGADADLALVDLDAEWTLDASTLQTRSGLSPYVGMRFRGRVERTLVRGRTVYADGTLLAKSGWGRFQPRRDGVRRRG